MLLLFYQASVHICAVAFVFYLFAWHSPAEWPRFDLAFWLIIGLVSHAIQFEPGSFQDHRMRVSVGFASSIACIILFPPPLAALLVALNSLSMRDLTGKNAWYKVLFNRSMFALSSGLGALVFRSVYDIGTEGSFIWLIISGMSGSVVYYTVNSLLVTLVLALALQRSVRQVWTAAGSLLSNASYITLSATGTGLAIAYTRIGPLSLAVFAVPLVASYVALRNTWGVHHIQQLHTQVVRQARELQRFVSPLTSDKIRQGDEVKAGNGELREFAILFSDMRGFTSFADKLDPNLVFDLLSRSLSLQTDLVLRHGGHLDKIYGDGFLAYFEGAQKVDRALLCALQIAERTRNMQLQIGAQTLPVGLAVHVGPVLFGFLGTQERVDHTVAGDVVNVCARLCGQAQPFQVVVTEAVKGLEACNPAFSFCSLGATILKGKSEPTDVFQVTLLEEQGELSLL